MQQKEKRGKAENSVEWEWEVCKNVRSRRWMANHKPYIPEYCGYCCSHSALEQCCGYRTL